VLARNKVGKQVDNLGGESKEHDRTRHELAKKYNKDGDKNASEEADNYSVDSLICI
jgi:hypothetical protein